MNALGSRFIALLLAGLLAGAGWYQWEKNRLGQEIAELQAARRVDLLSRITIRTTPPARPESLPVPAVPAPNPDPVGKSPPPSPVLQDLAGLLENGTLRNARWFPVSNDIAATLETLIPYLELAPADAAALRSAVAGAKQEVLAGITATATVTRPSDGELVISVKDSSSARIAAIRMQDTIKEIIGETRYGIYEGVGAKAAIDSILNNGLNPATVTVTRTFNEARGINTYAIQRQTAMGGGSGSGGSGREYLASNLGLLGGFVPEDF